MKTSDSAYHAASVAAVSMLILLSTACTGETASVEGAAETAAAGPVAFAEVTDAAGLGGFRHDNGAAGRKWYPEQMGSGGGFFDYDGDGWQDILLLGGGTWAAEPEPGWQALRLYRNNGDGTFTDATDETGLGGLHVYTIGMAAADYDNDGDADLFLSNLGPNMLLRNDAGSASAAGRRFTDVSAAAGVNAHSEWGSSALFFDADRDGDLDLYAGNYVDWSPESDKYCPEGSPVKLYCVPADYEGIPSRYYVNNGDGTFADRTEAAGFLPNLGKSLGVAMLDFNADGWPDLAVANDGEGDLLYVNNGDGTFTERGVRSGFAFSEHGEARAGMGIDAGVVDTTGQVSIFVGNFSEEMAGVYRHLGGGLFIDRAAASRVGHASLLTLTFGLFLFDVDLDGDLDLLTANGHVYPDRLKDQDKITFRQRTQLYLNRGDGTFDEAPARGPLDHPMVARGAAYADYDRDGDLDVLITENDGPAHLWRNDSATGAHVALQLVGRSSNRDAVGAHVVLYAGGRGQERRVRTGSSYLSQSTLWQHFGLGGAAAVDSVVVTWPSGAVERHGPVPVGGAVRIIEGQPTVEAITAASTRTAAR